MSLEDTLQLTQRIIAWAVILQTIELYLLRGSIETIWQWRVIRSDFRFFPGFLQRIFDATLDYPRFFGLLATQCLLAAGILVFPGNALSPSMLGGLLLTTLFINFRFRGTFNGGSDQMTIIILLALTVGSTFPRMASAAAFYICLQTCLSFLLSGLVKLRFAGWRNGTTLTAFLQTALCEVPQPVSQIMRNHRLAYLSSWAVIVFEVAFPLALLNKRIAACYVATALVFHVVNFYVFGFNRFIFAWAAAYPSVYYCSRS